MMNASTCADLNAITGTVNNFSLEQVTVVYAKSPYYYVQDATGTTLVYKASYGLQAGDVVTGISGTAVLYSGLPELSNPTAYSSLTVTPGTAPTIPDATVAPTVADVNKVFWFRDVNMGNQSFTSSKKINLHGIFNGSTIQFRNAWTEAYPFDSTKTYDILGCVAIYNSSIQVYAADIQEHHETGFNPIVVGAEKPSTWNAMYLYAWANVGGNLLGGWPGTLVNVDSAGWAYHTFEGVSEVNYIWNDGSGIQTVDLYTDASICQRLVEAQPHSSSGNWTATTVECGSHATQPSDTVTPQPIDTVTPLPISSFNVGFQANNWESLYLYAWTDTGEPLGGWPGIEVQRDSLGWAYYTFNLESVNYIWNDYNNHKQTKNLATTESKCERVGSLLDDTQYNAVYDVEAVACGSAWPSDTVTPTPIDTITPTPVDTTGHDTIPLPGTEITLGFGNAFAWDSVYLYAWDENQNPLTGAWPGTQMTLDSSQWAYKTFSNVESVNYIWSNGKNSNQPGARQTQDLTANASVCQAVDPFVTNYPFGVVEIECGANPDFVFDLSFEQALAVGALADITNPSYYTYRTTGVVSSILTSPENVDRYKNCDFFIANPNNPNDNSIECFRTRWLHDQAMYADNMPAVGDTVTIVGSLQYYQGRTVEFNRGYIESIARQVTPDTIVPQEPITVKLLASSVREVYDCNYVNLYAWRTEPDGSYIDVPLGGWPGTSVPLDSATGWYHYTFAPEIQDVNIIWSRGCDGGYRQTQDIMHVTYNQCFRLMQDSSGIIAVGANCSTVEPILPDTVAPQPQTGYTVKLLGMSVPSNWNEVRLYSWTPGVDPALSTDYGLALTLDSLGWYSYTFQNLEMVDLLFNNGAWGAGNQTVDARVTSDVCYAFGNPNSVENNRYPLISVDCIHPDSITPTPIDTGGTCIVYILDNITLAVYDSIVVPYGGNAVLPTDRLPEYDGYHFVFWEGLYDGSNVLYNVTTDKWAQAKYYINLPEAEPANPVTVRLDPASVPESWENVYVFSWTTGAMDAEWPGALMTRDTTGWLTYTFPAGVQEIDFLFNNGEGNIGNQTVDVDNVSSDYCFRIANPWWPTGYYLVYPTECETQPQPQPQGMTIRLMEEYYYGGWYADNYIYAWQHDDSTGVDTPLLGEWPGQPMEKDSLGWWTYTFAQEYDKVNIVFNSITNSVQTVDILNVTESSCFQIGEGLGYFDGMYVHECARVDCSIAPSMYHIVYFYGLNDSYLGMSRVVEGQAAVAPEAPVVPGYTFVGWDQDFSYVMGQMMVHAVYQYNGGSGDGITVRLLSPNGTGWANVGLYAWATDSMGNTTQLLGDWPGIIVPADSTGWCSFTFNTTQPVNIIWNDASGRGGHYQTSNIMNVGTSACFRIYGRDSLEIATPLLMDCETEAATYHTVAFVSLGETLMLQQVPTGSTIDMTPSIPYREGYEFAFWADVNQVKVEDMVITEDKIIYAWWRPIYYMVYILDGLNGNLLGSGEVNYHGYVSNMDELIPQHEGYEFIGWTNDLQDVTDVSFAIAQFRPVSGGNYSVVYEGKDGEFLSTHGVDLTLPTPPEYEGYVFTGWQVLSSDLTQGTISIQAVYESTGGTGAPEVNGEQGAKKVLRDSHVYILTKDGKVFSSDGKLVEVER